MVCPANDEAPQLERTFASYAENEWSQYMRDRWKSTTQTTQGSFVTQHIRPYFDSLALPEITPAKIAAFHQALEAKGLGKKTRKNIHAILHTMFEYAVETLELLPKSPVKKRLAPKVEKHEKPSLTPGEAWSFGTCWRALNNPPSRLLRRAPVHRHPHWRGAWAEMGRCGPRQPSANHQTCHHSRQRNDAEDQGESRTLLISPELYTALLNHKAMAHYTQPADYVFSSSSGRSTNPDLLRETLQSVLRDKLKITLGPREDGLHLLRHTSGSLVFQQTGSVKEAQAWLGHSSSRITMDTYVHLMKESQQGTAELVFARPEIPAVPQKGQEN